MSKGASGIKDFVLKQIATVGSLGFAPFASGTVGTLPAALLVWLVPMNAPVYIALTIAVTIAGIIAADNVEQVLGKKDPGCVVVDEFAGYLVSMAFVPVTTLNVIVAFFVFRFFDVLKPPPIRQIERGLRGGVGIMMDDIAAGVATNLALQIWLRAVQ